MSIEARKLQFIEWFIQSTDPKVFKDIIQYQEKYINEDWQPPVFALTGKEIKERNEISKQQFADGSVFTIESIENEEL